MIPFFVAKCSEKKGKQSVADCKQVHGEGWDRAVDYNAAKIFYINEQWVQVEEFCVASKSLDGVENCRHIHKEQGKDTPKVLNITEKHVHSGEYKTYTDVENYEAYYRDYEHKASPCNRYPVYYAENHINHKCKTEIYKRGNVS